MITGQDRKLAKRRAKLDRDIEEAFGDTLVGRHPLLDGPRKQFIVESSLEQILEQRTKLLRLRYCQGTNPEHGVHVLVTTTALAAEYEGEAAILTREDVLTIIRRFVSEEISVEAISATFSHGDKRSSLTLPSHTYRSFYLYYRP